MCIYIIHLYVVAYYTKSTNFDNCYVRVILVRDNAITCTGQIIIIPQNRRMCLVSYITNMYVLLPQNQIETTTQNLRNFGNCDVHILVRGNATKCTGKSFEISKFIDLCSRHMFNK